MVRRSDSPGDETDTELDADVDGELAADLRQIAETRLALAALRGLHEVRLSADVNTIELTLEEISDIALAIDDVWFPESPSECIERLDTELLPLMDRCGILEYNPSVRIVCGNVITSLVWLILEPRMVDPKIRDNDEVAVNAAWVLMWFNDVGGTRERRRRPH